MPKGYWIVSLEPTDMDRLGKYVQAVTPFLEARGATYLVRGGQFEAAEGSARPLNVIVEFPDYASAVETYRSDAYTAIVGDRLAAADGDLVIVEGV